MMEEEIPPQISLSENEEVREILHRKFVSILFTGITIILIISLIIGIIVYAFTEDYTLFMASFLIPLGVGIALLFVIGYPYTNGHRYIITNRRIIIYKKFISITTRDVLLVNLTDLILQVGIYGRIFKYGTILPVSPGLEITIGPSLFIQLNGIGNVIDTRNRILDYKRSVSKEITITPPTIEYISEVEEPIIPYIKILPDEKIYLNLNRKYWSFFFKIIWFFGIFFSLFIYSLIEYFIEILSVGEYTKIYILFLILTIIFAILSIIFSIVLILGVPYVRSHRYYVTSRRLIMFKKFVSITYREVFYEKITDIIVKAGPIARLLNYGGLKPVTAAMEYRFGGNIISIGGVSDVHEIRNKIMNIKNRYEQETY